MTKPRKRILKVKAQIGDPIKGSELREWRDSLGWTQKEAAQYLGQSLRSYENWEQGHRPVPYPVTIRRLMDHMTDRKAS